MASRAEASSPTVPSFTLAERAGAVLVVDDSATMRTVVRRILNQLGVENVLDAPDAASAFTIMNQKPFGVVICDVQMEPHSGFHLLRAVRETPEITETPIVMMTASLDAKNVEVARHRGADAYILKPFSADALRQKMEQVLPMGRYVEAAELVALTPQVVDRRVRTFSGSR